VKGKQDIISRKDIVRVLAVIISNWHILLLLPLIAFALSYVFTHRIPDIYAAKCQILLKSNETYDYQQQLYRGLGFSSKYASYEETASQMRVIKSTNLIDEVLTRIPLNVSYYIVGRLKVSEVYAHIPFRVISDDRYRMPSGMEFRLNILDLNSYRLQYELDGISKDKVFGFGELVLEDGLYFKIDQQSNVSENSISMLSKINYIFKVFQPNSLLSKLKGNIEVKNIDYTSIVEISFKDEIPARAVEVLDTLANIYVLNTVKNQIAINDNTVSYIDKQLGEVIDIIKVIENELELFKEQKEILNLSKEEETFYSKLVEFESEKEGILFELHSIDDLTNYLLENNDVRSLLPPSIFVSENDAKLQAQISELYELRAEFSGLSGAGTASNPKIEGVFKRIEDLKQDVLVYLSAREEALKSRVSELHIEIGTLEQKIKNIPKTQRQVMNIERRLMVNEELYSFLLSKRAETVIAKAGLVPETKIIENARSVGVVYPDKSRMNLINMLLGLGLAVSIVLLKVLFFQKITSLGQLQTATDISILGSIPKKKDFSKTYRILSGSERSDVVQAFRSLRTNLQYFSKGQKCTKVLVTSLMPGEGKTFTSVNLASVMAIADKKILIIDFDLHKPRLAKAMQLENDFGVSNFLIGDKSIEEIIKKTEIETLDVITSGPVPPNASELILRKELKDVFSYAEDHYDFVFLDTPPISLITDGLILMNEVDVKLFVLNCKSTSKTSIDFLERLVGDNDIKGAALILNEEKLSRINYYYSRYGYGGYGYGGYGYGGYGYGGYGGYGQSKFYGQDPTE
jgi:tyrosine-protein kinase Etk/Wzc